MKTELQQRIELEQIGMVYRYASNVFGGLVVLGSVLAYVITLDHSVIVAAVWLLLLLSTSLVRWLFQRRFLSRERVPAESEQWRKVVIGGAALTGFAWSLPGTLLLPAQLEAQLFLCACMMGIVSAAVAALAPLRHAFTGFVVPFLVPVALAQLAQGGNNIYFGIGLLTFMGAMLGVAHRYHADVVKMLALVYENEELAARLAKENRHAVQINTALQAEIIERQRVEQSLQEAKSQAEEASRVKSQFLANMSHEVRTPLHTIMGITELLQTTQLDVKHTKLAGTAHDASRHLLGIVNDILDLSRVEAGRMQLHHEEFSPRRWLMDIVETATAQAAAKNLRLHYEVDATVPAQLGGDPERLRQILVNLVVNAIKFTDVGSIDVVLRVYASAANRSELYCVVTDTGAGIAADQQDQLFQPFSQLDSSTTRRFGGAGLGLAICKQLVDAMSGRIGFESVVGRGSTFWFAVPVGQSNVVAAASPDSMAAPRELKGHVLVAEDNAVNCELLIDMLQSLGCTTTVVQSGQLVLEQVLVESFDAIIMDWHMPVMDGLQAARLIRAQGICAKNSDGPIPIIALTASVMAGDREACIAAGMNDYLGKPFSFDALTQVLRRWLPH